MPCEGPGLRLIERPIRSGKFELHAHTSRRTVEVARAAGGVFPRSAGQPSPRDSHCSIGRPESRPGWKCACSAQLPRTCKQGQIVRSKLALNFEHVHRQSFGECIARSAVMDFEEPTSGMGDGPHRHAQRVRRTGVDRPGDAEAQSSFWTFVRLSRPARRSHPGDFGTTARACACSRNGWSADVSCGRWRAG